MLPLIGSLVGAGTSLLGGLMGQQNQADINAQNIAMQEQINTQNIQNQDALNAQNIAEQEKFAQSGVQWRVADAKAAGISPLAALGAQTSSFANNVGATATAPQAQSSNAFGTGIANAGQNIARGIQAMASPEDKIVAAEKTRQDLEKGQLENDLLKQQIYNSNVRTSVAAPGTPPGVPMPIARPMSIGANDQETVVRRTADGDLVQGPSRDTEGWSWSDPWTKAQYVVRNQVQPAFGFNIPPDVKRAIEVPGEMSAYKNPLTGTYYGGISFMDDVRKAFRYMRGDFN